MNELVELLVKSLLIGVLIIVVTCVAALVTFGIYHYISLIGDNVGALLITALVVGYYLDALLNK